MRRALLHGALPGAVTCGGCRGDCFPGPGGAHSHPVSALGPQASSSTLAMVSGTARRRPWPPTQQGLLTVTWTIASDAQPCPQGPGSTSLPLRMHGTRPHPESTVPRRGGPLGPSPGSSQLGPRGRGCPPASEPLSEQDSSPSPRRPGAPAAAALGRMEVTSSHHLSGPASLPGTVLDTPVPASPPSPEQPPQMPAEHRDTVCPQLCRPQPEESGVVYLGRKTRRSPSPASAELPPEGPEDCDPPHLLPGRGSGPPRTLHTRATGPGSARGQGGGHSTRTSCGHQPSRPRAGSCCSALAES